MLLDRDAVLAVRDHPSWACTLGRLTAAGLLVRVLPGVYTAPHRRHEVLVKCLALRAKDPDVVITGQAALALQSGAAKTVPVVEFISTRRFGRRSGFLQVGGRVPDEHVRQIGPLRCTSQQWAAVERSVSDDGAAIDDVLRRTECGAAAISNVLTVFGKRRGNPLRRLVVDDSRDTPWSYAERKAHRMLRAAKITGWSTNLPVTINGANFRIDLAFPALKLAIEVDGFAYHSSRDSFERDRQRQNLLVADGWTVLRFTWAMLDDPDAVLRVICETIERLTRQQRLRRRPLAA